MWDTSRLLKLPGRARWTPGGLPMAWRRLKAPRQNPSTSKPVKTSRQKRKRPQAQASAGALAEQPATFPPPRLSQVVTRAKSVIAHYQPDLKRRRLARKSPARGLRRRRKVHEVAIESGLFACGLLSIFTTVGIVLVLGNESIAFFTRDQWLDSNRALPTISEFFTNTKWIPAIGEFGVLPLINATLMTSTIALLVALPLGISTAIYLSEYASAHVRSTLKPALEILAGIPTVVYGYFALTFMTPLLRAVFGVDVVNIYNTGAAGIVVGILIIPLVSSMSEDALYAVPNALREASYGLGATKLETVIKVVVPAALSGILAAFIVAASRAIGETMIVAIAAGAGPRLSFSPFESAETMTGHIARISGGDLSYDSLDYNSIFAIGLTLFVMTFVLNVLSRVIITRFREAY